MLLILLLLLPQNNDLIDRGERYILKFAQIRPSDFALQLCNLSSQGKQVCYSLGVLEEDFFVHSVEQSRSVVLQI